MTALETLRRELFTPRTGDWFAFIVFAEPLEDGTIMVDYSGPYDETAQWLSNIVLKYPVVSDIGIEPLN